MKMHGRSTKDVTLFEIMVAVVVIESLAAMDIHVFEKIRISSLGKTALNDALRIGAGGRQCFMEYGRATVNGIYISTIGKMGCELNRSISQISKSYSAFTTSIDSITIAFSGIFLKAAVGGIAAVFDAESKKSELSCRALSTSLPCLS